MLSNWIEEATSPGGILAFVLGIFTAISWHGVVKPWWLKRHDRPVKYRITIKLTNIIMAVAVLSVVWTGVRYTELAHQVAQCQAEFNQALRVRGEITEQNDYWSRVQRTALANWLHDLIFPPPDIAMLESDDPKRQIYSLARTTEADRVIRQAQQEQDANVKPPYPDPTCGR